MGGRKGQVKGALLGEAEELEIRGEPLVSLSEILTDSVLENITLEAKKGTGGQR